MPAINNDSSENNQLPQNNTNDPNTTNVTGVQSVPASTTNTPENIQPTSQTAAPSVQNSPVGGTNTFGNPNDTPLTSAPSEPMNPLPPQPEPNPAMSNPQPVNSGQPPVVVPPTDGNDDEMVTTSGNRGSGIKKIGLILVVILLLGAIGFALYNFVFKRIGGGAVSEPDPVSITWWGLWEEESIVEPVINNYQQQNPHVTINYVKQSKEDYRERLTNALAQGNGPDVFRFHNTWIPMFKSDLASLPENIYPQEEYAATFYPVMVGDLSSTNGYLGIPLEYEGLALFVNEDIFAQAAKSPPSTWDEVRDIAQELTIKDESGVIIQAGIGLGLTQNVDHWQEILALMMLQNGADLTNPTNSLASDALSFYTLFASGDSAVWDSAQPNTTVAFASGNLAMYLGPSWRIFEIQRINPSLNFRVVELPQLPKSNPSDPDVAYASYWVEGVSQSSSQKDEAWKFLKYMSTQETLQQFFTSATTLRAFGEPYPRVDMRESLLSNEYLAAYISQASDAESWYLASRTWDGPTGINSQLSGYYEDAINAVLSGEDPQDALLTTATGVNQVLSQYGLVAPIQTVPQP